MSIYGHTERNLRVQVFLYVYCKRGRGRASERERKSERRERESEIEVKRPAGYAERGPERGYAERITYAYVCILCV
jgi:hypothetical protein